MTITGRVVYKDLEGGFWGIEDDAGRRFQPVNGLPRRFQKDGRRIKARVEPSDMASTAMWGHTVRLVEIEDA